MLAKCILNIRELNWYQRFGDNKKILKICHHPHNFKMYFTSWKEREHLRNVQKLKLHVQSMENYCSSLSNMQIYDVLVVVAQLSSLMFLCTTIPANFDIPVRTPKWPTRSQFFRDIGRKWSRICRG